MPRAGITIQLFLTILVTSLQHYASLKYVVSINIVTLPRVIVNCGPTLMCVNKLQELSIVAHSPQQHVIIHCL